MKISILRIAFALSGVVIPTVLLWHPDVVDAIALPFDLKDESYKGYPLAFPEVQSGSAMIAPFPNGPTDGVVIATSILFAERGDRNENDSIDAGDKVTLNFIITNKSNAPIQFATLDAGLSGTPLRRFWNLRGATGFTKEGESLLFPNIYIAPLGKIEISVDATLEIFTEGEREISLNPILFSAQGNEYSLAPMPNGSMRMLQSVQKVVEANTSPLWSMRRSQNVSSFSTSQESISSSDSFSSSEAESESSQGEFFESSSFESISSISEQESSSYESASSTAEYSSENFSEISAPLDEEQSSSLVSE